MIFERSNTPVEPGVLERVMDRLKHRGPDGRDEQMAGHVSLGHWHFWTTPEELGEKQPLKVRGLPFTIVLDGRLDNRPDLISKLNLNPAEGDHVSDAALMLHAYDRWGEACFKHFIGDYALVILDEQKEELLCARDSLGNRTLFYSFKGTRLVVASEPWAVAWADGQPPELDDRAVAHYFALRATEDGQTLFMNIYELLPARVMAVTASGQRTWNYWQPDFSIRLRGKSDEDYAQEYRSLLEESVRCRLRSTTPVGVLMSGGLDSTSVACLAARMIVPRQLTTISCIFEEFPDCDERQYINAVASQYSIRSIQIPCDDLYPFHNWPDWPRNPNYPISNFYSPIRERAHQRTQQEGMRVLLTGDYGDHLYSGAEDWLADLISEGRLLGAGKEVIYHLRQPGLTRKLATVYLRRLARRVLDTLPFGQHLHPKSQPPAWLTPLAAQFLSLKRHQQGSVSERLPNMVGLWTAQTSAMEAFYTSKHELELRCPYRDRRLVEFMLTIPAHQLYHRGLYRQVLRNAMHGILPEIARTRNGKTSMSTLFFYGLERKRNDLQTFFSDPHAIWKNYVDSDWLLSRWGAIFAPYQDGAEKVVPWLSVAFVVWYKYYIALTQDK